MIYFIQGARTGYIKIGHTAKASPMSRLRSLRTAATESLSLIGVMDGDSQAEKTLHARFDFERETGEWFKPSESLVNFIVQHARVWLEPGLFYEDGVWMTDRERHLRDCRRVRTVLADRRAAQLAMEATA